MNNLGFRQSSNDNPLLLWSLVIGVGTKENKESVMVNHIRVMECKSIQTDSKNYLHKIEFLALENFKENQLQELLIGENGIFPIILDFTTFIADRAIVLLQRNGTCPCNQL